MFAVFGFIKYRDALDALGRPPETRCCWMTKLKVFGFEEESGKRHERPLINFGPGGPANWTRYT